MKAKYLVLYDGICGLCNRSVRFLLSIDKNACFTYAPLQGSTAKQIFQTHKLPANLPRHPDTIILVTETETGEQVCYYRSDAIVEICHHLPSGWRWLYWLKVIPRPIRNWLYDFIAVRRYRWFGKYDTCPLPPPELQDRFLP